MVLWNIYKCGVWDVYICGTVEYKQVWCVGTYFCGTSVVFGMFTSVVLWNINKIVFGIFTSVVLWNIKKVGLWDVYFCGTVEYIQVWCLEQLNVWYCGI